VTTRSAAGAQTIAWLPGYKGDAAAAAQRLLAAAAQPGSSAQLQMLADMVRDRGGQDWRALHSPLMEYEELLLEARGRAGGARAGGFVRLGWTDDIDGSTQFCRAYLPSQWPPRQPAPTLIFLHGYNPPNPPYVRWWSIGDATTGSRNGTAWSCSSPWVAATSTIAGWENATCCVAWTKHAGDCRSTTTRVHQRRIHGRQWHVAGGVAESAAFRGRGAGVWRLGLSHHRLGLQLHKSPGHAAHGAFRPGSHASFAGAEGLRNVPLYVLHGDADAAVPVEQSRHGVRLLQRWGYDVRYREVPGSATRISRPVMKSRTGCWSIGATPRRVSCACAPTI
jgi:hypothetical protein